MSDKSTKPRTRQRIYKPPPPLEVPDIEDDAAERKRILNVLAQRRYREKKRQRRLRDGKETRESTTPREGSEEATSVSNDEMMPVDMSEPVETVIPHTATTTYASPGAIFGVDLSYGGGWDPLHDLSLSMMPDASGNSPFADFLIDDGSGNNSSSSSKHQHQHGGSIMIPSSSSSSSLAHQSIPSLVSLSASSSSAAATVPSSLMMSNVLFGSPPSLVEHQHHSSTSPSTTSTSTSTSTSDVSSFPDSYHLPVHELTILRAMLRIADRLGCKGTLWSLDALSPFNQGIGTPADQLPVPWRPTPSQVLIPHHPLFDFLPWPSVRDKIIGILSLPDEARPPGASGPLALVNFAYDFEDNSEGVRIYGSDPYDPSCWEVGQILFQRWWFLFDRDIVENSNRWRSLRGAPPLALTDGKATTV